MEYVLFVCVCLCKKTRASNEQNSGMIGKSGKFCRKVTLGVENFVQLAEGKRERDRSEK